MLTGLSEFRRCHFSWNVDWSFWISKVSFQLECRLVIQNFEGIIYVKKEKIFFPVAIVILVSRLDRNRDQLTLVNLENLKMYWGGDSFFFFFLRRMEEQGKEREKELKKGKTHKTRHHCPARVEYWTERQKLCKWLITNNPYVKKVLVSSQIAQIDRSPYLTGCLQQPIRGADERSIIVQINKKPI